MTSPIFRLDGAAYETTPFFENRIIYQLMGVLIDNIKISAIIQIENQNHKVFQVMLRYEILGDHGKTKYLPGAD
jgi:hypothetical protein